jgi:hypothetical protein
MKIRALGLVLLLVCSSVSWATELPMPNNGHFIMYQEQSTNYLLDNQTGSVWHLVRCSENDQPIWQCWERMEFINTTTRYSPKPIPGQVQAPKAKGSSSFAVLHQLLADVEKQKNAAHATARRK